MDNANSDKEEEEEGGFEVLKLVGNKVNAKIIVLLRRHPMSPRDLSKYLGKKEGDIVRRLKAMERHGLVKGSWGSRLGQNVKLYSLTAHDISVKLGQDGLQVRYSKGRKGRGYKSQNATANAARATRLDAGLPPPQPIPPLAPPSSSLGASYDASSVVGRTNELKLLSQDRRATFFFIDGIAGIGKTSLARKFVTLQQQAGSNNNNDDSISRVFWHTFKEIDTLAYIVGKLALFLSRSGAGDLLRHLDASDGKNNGAPDESLSLEIMVADLNRLGNCILVFDDYHRVRDEKISVLLRHLQLKLEPKNKMLVLSRSKPPFFLDNIRSRELALSGLSLEESEEMMLASFGTNAVADRSAMGSIWSKFAGHPMAMKIFCILAMEGEDKSRTKKPPEIISLAELLTYFRKEILELLSEDELSVLMSLSVFRTPVRMSALRSSVQKRNLNHLMYSLERKMMVSRTAAGQEFFLHDMLREALYSMVAYPEEAHQSAAQYYLSENTAESTVESLYHLVKCRNIAKIAAILGEEFAEEKYRFLEEGYATPILEILGQVSASRIVNNDNNKNWLVYFYNIEGKALSMLGRWDEARERLEMALRTAHELHDPLLIAHSQKVLSEAAYLQGDFQAAEKHLVEAAAIFEEHGMKRPLNSIYMKLARLCFATGRPEESKSYSDRAKSVMQMTP